MEVDDVRFNDLFNKSNKDKELEKTGIKKLLDKDGFYIIMFICVCVVGISAVWVAKSNVDRYAEEDVNPPSIEQMIGGDMIPRDVEADDSVVVLGNEDKVIDVTPSEKDTTKKVIKKGKVLVENKAEEAVPVATIQEPDMALLIWPVKGEIGMDFAVETLAYSKTLEHFTTHHGIDILAEIQSPVKAALGGEVIEILSDSRLGLVISIQHENGIITRYGNLYTDAMVSLGERVSQGQTISGVGDSSIFESGEGPHLHFEVIVNEESVNPYEYFAKN